MHFEAGDQNVKYFSNQFSFFLHKTELYYEQQVRDRGGSAKFSNEISWELFLLFNISTLQHSGRVYFHIFILSIGNYSKLEFFLLREVNFIDRISSSGNKPVCWLFLYLTSLKCVSPHFGHLLEKFTSFFYLCWIYSISP